MNHTSVSQEVNYNYLKSGVVDIKGMAEVDLYRNMMNIAKNPTTLKSR
jgi:hypothetical protein